MFGTVMGALERGLPMATTIPELIPIIRQLLTAVTKSFSLGHGMDSGLEESLDALQRAMEQGPPQEEEIPPEQQPPTPEEQQMMFAQQKQQWETEKAQIQAQMKQLQAQLDTQERVQSAQLDVQKAAQLSEIKVQEELRKQLIRDRGRQQ